MHILWLCLCAAVGHKGGMVVRAALVMEIGMTFSADSVWE